MHTLPTQRDIERVKRLVHRMTPATSHFHRKTVIEMQTHPISSRPQLHATRTLQITERVKKLVRQTTPVTFPHHPKTSPTGIEMR